MLELSVLISGRGTNLEALVRAIAEGRLKARIGRVVSNRPDAGGLQIATSAGIPTEVVDHRLFPDRASFEHELAKVLPAPDKTGQLLVLAGFMRILSDDWVRPRSAAMINIHPSLLPLYQGLNTHQRALDAGDKSHGASCHFVIPALDSGPVISQVCMNIETTDDAGSLARRLLPLEHQLLVATVELFTRHRVEPGKQQVIIDDQPIPKPLLLDAAGRLDLAGHSRHQRPA